MHLTIGEVLSLLKEEFPDVSISKIRFLESQGLVDPERTPSGYRKFYDHDVDRLRWILRQQREHFLPLKVIRGRLTGEDGDGESELGEQTDASLVTEATPASADVARLGGTASDVATGVAGQVALAFADEPATDEPASGAPSAGASSAGAAPGGPEVESGRDEHREAGAGNGNRPGVPTPDPVPLPPRPEVDPAADPEPEAAPRAGARAESARPGRGPRSQPQADVDVRAPAATAHPDVFTAAELAGHVGCAVALINELVQYGILTTGANVGGVSYFDPGSLALARIGARFSELGVEPRHLRTWRNAAEREAGLFEQLVMPLLRQRNPQSRQQAVDRLDELTRLGGDLRAGLVAEAIRQIR